MLKFDVRTNFTGILEGSAALRNVANRAEIIMATQVMKDTEEYVPALTGSLSQRTHLEGSTIVYPGPYARFLYYGKVMVYEPTGSTWAPRYQHKVVTDRDLEMHKTMHALATSHWFEVSKAQNLKKWARVAERAMTDAN